MKEATGELNMTLVTIIAIAAVLGFVVIFLPDILGGIGDKWDESTDKTVATPRNTTNKSTGGATGGDGLTNH